MDNYYYSSKYEESLSKIEKKKAGIYYTPKIIVEYILKDILLNHNIIDNPQPKILDLSCGCGNFLLDAYDILYRMIDCNIDEIKKKYGKNYIININNHIIEKCIYGVDIDQNAINILKGELRNKKKYYDGKEYSNFLDDNIICEDGLKYNFDTKFDYIVGNPPYVGHKVLNKEYKKFLHKNYKEVYRDKGDLYFCFYKRAVDLISEEGKIGYITPRYFIESPSGKNLRVFLFENTKIQKIVDLNDINVFKNIGISPVIMIFTSNNLNSNSIIKIYKNKEGKKHYKEVNKLEELINSVNFERIGISQENLKNNWILVNDEDREFVYNIENSCSYELGEIVVSFQGIITGCDKAFIMKNNDDRICNIDKDILKVWIKNKNINSYIIDDSEYRLIYSNDILNLDDHKYIEKYCLYPYKEKLQNRRECVKNMRRWYELQWGREKYLFERKKIMYPYKSSSNKFAIDYKNSFSSADVYSLYIKEEFENEFSLEYLVGILNSSIYDRYFKIIAKKLGNNLYDYYPNKVMKIKIFKDDNYEEIENLSKLILDNKIKINKYKNKIKLQDKDIAFNKEIYCLENESHFLENRIRKLIIKSLKL